MYFLKKGILKGMFFRTDVKNKNPPQMIGAGFYLTNRTLKSFPMVYFFSVS